MDKRSRRISAPQFKIVYLCCVGESPPVETSLASVQAAQKQLSPVPTWQSSVSFSVCRAAGFLVRLVRRPVRTHCSAALFFLRRDMNRSRAAAGTEDRLGLNRQPLSLPFRRPCRRCSQIMDRRPREWRCMTSQVGMDGLTWV